MFSISCTDRKQTKYGQMKKDYVKQIVFVLISISVCSLLIMLTNSMYTADGGNGLGAFINSLFVTAAYTLYTLYHLFTYKTNICRKDILTIILLYGVSVLPFLTMWLWELLL